MVVNLASCLARWVRKIRVTILAQRHYTCLKPKAWQSSPEYEQYLDTQLRRTLSKKNAPLPKHAPILIDKMVEFIDPTQSDVLCIGSRNTAEIDYFRSKGAKNVVGIDLYSEDQAILVMDMHQMTFPDDHFDIIYSCHSLEHAYDIQKVVNEIVRVGRPGGLVVIEVPVRYETKGADLVDFGNCAGLHAAFEPYVATVLWCDEQPPYSSNNDSGTAIVRTIFSVCEEAI